MLTENQYCTFTLGPFMFGVGVREVQEVIRYQEMTRVPLAPRTVGGLINLRGQIVVAVDLRERLGLPARDSTVLPMNVVVCSDDGAVSLLVDEIGDVIEVSPSEFEAAPDTLTGTARDLITGVYKLEGKLLLVLDVNKTATTELEIAKVA
ncbi:MAG: chemotaxis protein CheW [Polyangiaceae bacterium]|nr:chemotaxis protein CheW [Polyangiaceae bacterium]